MPQLVQISLVPAVIGHDTSSQRQDGTDRTDENVGWWRCALITVRRFRIFHFLTPIATIRGSQASLVVTLYDNRALVPKKMNMDYEHIVLLFSEMSKGRRR